MNTHDQITAWLQDAHAMEQNLASNLERHIKDAQDLPALREQLSRHLLQTERHARQLKGCLETLGDSPSTVKAVAGGLMGAMEGMSMAFFRDGLVKDILGDYAMEHFEIACYTGLIAAAEAENLPEVAATCREILREEVAMADWLKEHIPEITRRHLQMATTS